MATASKHTPNGEVLLDADELRVQPDQAVFKKNLTFSVNKNGSTEGNNKGVDTPYEGFAPIAINSNLLPEGKNHTVGSYESKATNEAYVFVWNEHQNHSIYRINGVDGSTQLVYRSKLLNFQLDPRCYIAEVRCELRMQSYFNKASGKTEQRKFLLFTDGINPQRFISVEDSIATNSFDPVAFPYFAPKADITLPEWDDERVKYINLGVPTPMSCIRVDRIARVGDAEKAKQNLINYKGFQFRIKTIDVFGRESEHGVISERFFNIIGGGCIANSNGMPRCFALTFSAGNALVDKIQVEFRTCTANNKDLSVDSDWLLYDTIDKYRPANVNWWEREINNPYQVKLDQLIASGASPSEIAAATVGLLKYDTSTNTFTYSFCSDKMCEPIDVTETNRLFNPLPITSLSLFPIANGIGLGGNVHGFEPIDPNELEKIQMTVTPPVPSICSDYELRKIVVYAFIHNPWELTKAPNLQRPAGKISKNAVSDKVAFFSEGVDGFSGLITQKFPEGQTGFIGYLAGTKFYAISKQVRLNLATGDECELGVYINDTGYANNCEGNTNMIVQKFEFLVPPGNYIFRVAGHRSKLTDDYQKTSTFVYGRHKLSSVKIWADYSYPDSVAYPPDYVDKVKEMYISCCAGDVILNKPDDLCLVIWDTFGMDGDTFTAYTVEGYLYEDRNSLLPMELVKMKKVDSGASDLFTERTDHNGFFFAAAVPFLHHSGYAYEAGFLCSGSADLNIVHFTDNIVDIEFFQSQWSYQAFVLPAQGDHFPDVSRRTITGKIVYCDNQDVAIAGVPIVMKNGPVVFTDANGNFKMYAHNRDAAWLAANANKDTIIISQMGTCQLSRCDDPCNYCLPTYDIAYLYCAGGGGGLGYSRVNDIGLLKLSLRGINKGGPQNGGRYAWTVWGADWMGRVGFAQALDDWFLDIPTMNQTKTFDFSTLGFVIDAAINLPSWVKYLCFGISRNQNFDDFQTWRADKVTFVDNGGNEEAINPTKIRIYTASILEYSKQNNYSVNTSWQFIDSTSTNNAAIIGDRIEFIKNGDGTWYDNPMSTLVTYDANGKYVEIEYNGDLAGLKDGALIKFIRPKTCLTQALFFELCPVLKVIGGKPVTLSGTFDYKDSYFLTRQIPVPVEVVDPNDQTKTVTEIEIAYNSYFFEHPSPSDFWGDHCGTRGRVNVKNPYERQQFLGTEVAKSADLVTKSNYNGLSYFSSDQTTLFNEKELGGTITAVIPEVNTFLMICAYGNFIVGYNDTGLRMDGQGNVIAASLSNKFGSPQRKIGNEFGCQLIDINTIRKHNGIVRFFDRNQKAVVYHNYADAVDVAQKFLFQSYTDRKSSWQNDANNNLIVPRVYFHGGIDPQTDEYFLTSYFLPVEEDNFIPGGFIPLPVEDVFFNDQREWKVQYNETIVLDATIGYLKDTVSFTPEYFCTLESYYLIKNVVSFTNAIPWSHHNLDDTIPYNFFYGRQGKKVYELVTNISPEKVKRYMYNEVYCKEHLFEIDRIITESGQLSWLKAVHWDRREYFWCADFKCDANTPFDPNLSTATGVNKILDGDQLYGRWAKIRYVSRDEDDGKYCELDSVVVYVNGSEKSAD